VYIKRNKTSEELNAIFQHHCRVSLKNSQSVVFLLVINFIINTVHESIQCGISTVTILWRFATMTWLMTSQLCWSPPTVWSIPDTGYTILLKVVLVPSSDDQLSLSWQMFFTSSFSAVSGSGRDATRNI